ncbi:MAG: transcriptional regulator, TetR family [Gammaproteobacteria bacterium]|nr:transcriptional regulator, TetR family [Gammaproteobacteria bacterium]
MALLGTRKSSLRQRGIARRDKLLAAAETLLQSREMDAISLGDVALQAKVPKGSAYHFYLNIVDVYASLVALYDKELQAIMTAPIRSAVGAWSEVVEILLDRAGEFYLRKPSARQLLIGPKTLPELKMRDRQNDVVIGRIFEDQVANFFVLPVVPNRSEVFFRSVEIADLMFCLSMIGHGLITEEMTQEAKRGAVAYLGSYFPAKLPRKKRG